jgi:chaperonin GroEL (HSP60 family)
VPAGGALEIEVARQLREFGSKETGLDQYAIAKFADALEVVPRTIAENSGGAGALWTGVCMYTVRMSHTTAS